jgi:23S rRNA (cytosine1962-C5)-methyltransferase
MNASPTVVIKPRRARPFFGRHPWVFEGAVERVEGHPEPGEPVQVRSHDREFIAWGLYNPHSKIRVRLYSWNEDQPIDAALIHARLERAIRFRHEFLGLDDPRAACRLVYSESDGLSGLVVDRYADVIVVQFTSRAMFGFEPVIVDALARQLAPRAVFRRTERGMGVLEQLQTDDALVFGEPVDAPITIMENGREWLVDVTTGQKTGAYLDQRENRRSLCQYTRGRSVLDLFCYSGMFGMTTAALGGAREVLGVDVSGPAIELARANAERNQIAAEFVQESAFTAIERFAREGRRFGAVICDPPKFARSSAASDRASKGYQQINRLAIAILEPAGVLATCSCSGYLSPQQFLDLVVGAAQQAGRELVILEQRGQAPDHPVSAFCLETGYLKCIFARCVE